MLIKKTSIIFTLVIILLPFLIFAQTSKKFYFENISIPEGLSNTQVWDIVQDKYGFLWVATQDGLNRYDGYNFKVFKNDPEDKTSLPNNKLHFLLIDKEDNLWISTESGLSRYNRVNESIETFLPDSSRPNSSQNVVFKVFEDSKNRMWVGTTGGIFLFDRNTNKFELKYLKNGDNKTPTSGLTTSFLETSSGDIYSNYQFSGLIKYNDKTELFEKINVPKSKKWTLAGQPTINMFEDKTGKIWICSVLGLFTYDTHTNEFDKIDLLGAERTNNHNPLVTDIFQDENGYLWIATVGDGLFRYNLRTNNISKLKQSDFPQGINENDAFFRFFKDNFGVLWVGTFNKGLLKLDFQKEPFRMYEKPGGNANTNNNLIIRSILKSNHDDNIVWLGTYNGFFKYNMNDKSYKKFINKKDDKNSLPSDNVRSIVQLEDKGLWLGTGNGLSYFNISNSSFTNYKFFNSTDKYKISFNFINNIVPDDFGNLWLSTGNGLVKFDTKTKSSTIIPEVFFETYSQELLTIVDSLYKKNNSISSILEVADYQDLNKDFTLDKKTNIFMVSVGEGISTSTMADYGWLTDSKNDTLYIMGPSVSDTKYLNGNGKNRIELKTITLNPGSYKLSYHSDDSHSYGKWNADAPIDSAWWGIQVFSISDNDLTRINKLLDIDNNKPSIVGNYVDVAKYTKDGNIILGNDAGFSKYHISQNKIEHFVYGDNVPKTTNTTEVTDIFLDKGGIIWFATMGGLIRYDENTKQYNILLDKDGLPSNYLQAIQEDNFGNLWISTFNGITKFNKDVNHPIFINYDVKDGLQSYTFERRSSYKGKNGELFFGGINGFNAFHSGNINKQLPIVNISEMKINNKTVLPNTEDSPLTKSILDTKAIVLNYSQNNISFDFNSIHFSRPEKNKNAYMLEGFDKGGWIYTDRKFASYTNLPEGDYVFKVKGSNGDGIWNENGTSIKIKVLPPWWRTIWAYITYFFLLAGIVFAIDRIQRRRLLHRAQETARLNEAELRAQMAEAENERKSKELEEARELQLSMLPKELPKIPNLDIAVYMQTATEVGGDYYDFHVGMDGTLSVVIGDATGHGLNAGTIVTATKSLFSTLATNPDILFTFSEISRCIKAMKFKRLSMCLSLLKIEGNTLKMSAAGMPPALIYRENKKELEEIMLKGMPLGATDKFPYEMSETKLGRGDTILLSSDGFPELFNNKKEMFGYDRVKETFTEVADRSSEKIIEHLKNTASQWTDGKDPDDDVTFVVLKMK